MSGYNMPPGVSPGDIPGNEPEDDDERITDAVLAEMRRYVGNANPHPQNVQAALADLRDARDARDHNHRVSIQLHHKLHKATARVLELEDSLRDITSHSLKEPYQLNAFRDAVRHMARYVMWADIPTDDRNERAIHGYDLIILEARKALTEDGGDSSGDGAGSQRTEQADRPALDENQIITDLRLQMRELEAIIKVPVIELEAKYNALRDAALYIHTADEGRQAQYELMRAGNCYWRKNISESPIECLHVKRWRQPCPTDYRECPLTKDGEK